jgi:hypothetical protein
VTENDLVRMGANALTQAQYGGKQASVVATLEEALDIAHAQVKEPVKA